MTAVRQSSSPRARRAGQHAREHAGSLAIRMFGGLLALAAITTISAMVLGFHGRAFIAVELAAIAAMLAADRRVIPRIDRWSRGATGEEHVGAILDSLKDRGWSVIHDASLGRGNIDHILIGPAGILTVETKSHAGRINLDRIDQRMLSQAYAESKLIQRITGLPCDPLLVFSRAYLIGKVPARRRGVLILPARMLKGHLQRRRPELTIERINDIHGRLLSALDLRQH